MRVSIVTVCFNSASTIADTIKSVQSQNYSDIEHIIIDGMSKDNTLEIIKSCGHEGPLVSEKDNGLFYAMNKGIQLATGDIIGILNSDDFYTDEKAIDDVVEHFKRTNCDIVYGDLNYIDDKRNEKIIRKWRSGRFKYTKFNYGWMPPHPTVFVKKEIYDKYGSFNTELRSAADYELILRFLYKNKIKAHYVPRVLVNMRIGGNSGQSIKHRLKAHLEDYKAWKMNGNVPHWYTMFLKPLRKVLQYV